MRVQPTYQTLAKKISNLEKEALVCKQTEKRVQHLNRVLSSILSVSRLIRRVKSRKQLIQGVCDSLVEHRGYHNAWIVLFNDAREIQQYAEAGLGEDLLDVIDKISTSESICCFRRVLNQSEPLIIDNPVTVCRGCPLSHNYFGRGAMSIRLEHDDTVYGILTISVPTIFSSDREEHDLFRDVGSEIAYALHSIESEEKRCRSEAALRKARDELEQRVKDRTRELELLSTRLLTAQEEEQKRIAGDLHDGIGQSLSAVKIVVETILEQMVVNEDMQYHDDFKKLVSMLQDASDEVRTIVSNLRPSLLDDLGILTTISWLGRQFQSIVPDIRVQEYIDIQETEVPFALKTIIFRILQEALNNIAKHSDADRVDVHLSRTEKGIELQIKDNGYGLDMKRLNAASAMKKGFGLVGMKERAELSGGRFEIRSILGEGCCIRAFWNTDAIRSIS